MRNGSPAPIAALLALGLALPACHYARKDRATAGDDLSDADGARRACRLAFAQCAPPASFAPDRGVDALGVKSLVQISWRKDLDDRFTEKAAKRLRKLAERGDLETVREIARQGEVAETTLGRCRCAGEALRTEWEKQRIGEIAAARLPPAELERPAYWAERIEPHLGKLRTLSRRSAALLSTGDDASAAALEGEAQAEERALCEALHAARDALSADGMAQARDLVYQARARESGDASVELARREVDRAERRPSCASVEPAAATE